MYLSDSPSESPAGTTPIILEGIVRQRCITATYNRAAIVVAPHVLYTRHGELYVDAVTVSRNMVMAREVKLGTYKLSGLSAVRLTGREFEASDLFDIEAEKYAGAVLMAVEPGLVPAE
jgi:hypothetical protein